MKKKLTVHFFSPAQIKIKLICTVHSTSCLLYFQLLEQNKSQFFLNCTCTENNTDYKDTATSVFELLSLQKYVISYLFRHCFDANLPSNVILINCSANLIYLQSSWKYSSCLSIWLPFKTIRY